MWPLKTERVWKINVPLAPPSLAFANMLAEGQGLALALLHPWAREPAESMSEKLQAWGHVGHSSKAAERHFWKAVLPFSVSATHSLSLSW